MKRSLSLVAGLAAAVLCFAAAAAPALQSPSAAGPNIEGTVLKESTLPTVASEVAIESQLQQLGANAPRLQPADIDAVIVGKTFTTLPSGKVMVCELTLRNGFTVRGESAVVSVANFRQDVGERISYENARDKVWELEGYLLQERTAAVV
ncbi:Gp49 family protein [Paucibacter sp. O1-1]|nr:Gp49 family protein [Paucibacter sp. O1-1]MDA3826549.1 Gp49 family protein [Paucibacter sp. O1-1]